MRRGCIHRFFSQTSRYRSFQDVHVAERDTGLHSQNEPSDLRLSLWQMLHLIIDPIQGKLAHDGTVCRRLYGFQIASFFPPKLFYNLFNFSIRCLSSCFFFAQKSPESLARLLYRDARWQFMSDHLCPSGRPPTVNTFDGANTFILWINHCLANGRMEGKVKDVQWDTNEISRDQGVSQIQASKPP